MLRAVLLSEIYGWIYQILITSIIDVNLHRDSGTYFKYNNVIIHFGKRRQVAT